MLKNTHIVDVLWGDCDPARIIFYPNFYRWMDDASYHLFSSVGLGWKALSEKYGVPGLPLVSAHADFKAPTMFGDTLTIESKVAKWGTSSMTIEHTFVNAGVVAVEGWERRVWTTGLPDESGRLRSTPIPDEIKAIFEEG